MDAPRRTAIFATVTWMVGALFALWITSSAKATAQIASDLSQGAWAAFLVRVPWPIAWATVSLVLAALAWVATVLARQHAWAVYAYSAFVVIGLAVLYWAAVVLPANAFLANPL